MREAFPAQKKVREKEAFLHSCRSKMGKSRGDWLQSFDGWFGIGSAASSSFLLLFSPFVSPPFSPATEGPLSGWGKRAECQFSLPPPKRTQCHLPTRRNSVSPRLSIPGRAVRRILFLSLLRSVSFSLCVKRGCTDGHSDTRTLGQ